MKSILRLSTAAGIIALSTAAIAMQPSEVREANNSNLTTSTSQVNPLIFEQPAGMPQKAEASDSVNVTFKVTYEATGELVKNAVLMPTDITKLGFGITDKKAEYTYRVPKSKYDFYLWGSKPSYQGHTIYYKGNLNIVSDTVFDINTADINICTSFENLLPNGEVATPDLFLTSNNSVARAGNVRRGGECVVLGKFKDRNMHFNHTCHFLKYEAYQDPNLITNTLNDPFIWVNTKDVPLEFSVIYRYSGDNGVYVMRYNVNSSNFGQKLVSATNNWQPVNIKQKEIECDSVPAGFNPRPYSTNGYQVAFGGNVITQTIGYQVAGENDVKNKIWFNIDPNAPESNYEYAIYPGVCQTAVGTRPYGFATLPLSFNKSGIKFVPIQPIFTNLKIWSSSDGTTGITAYDSQFNPRLNADTTTLWGEGFPFHLFFPANKVAAGPTHDILCKGVNGEFRGGDVVTVHLNAYRQTDGQWNNIWSGIFTNLSKMNAAIKAAGVGQFAIETVDTLYTLGNHRGKSTTRIEFNNTLTDFNAPMITMINVRDKDDRITSELKNVEGTTVELFASDLAYNFVKLYGYKRSDVKGVKIEYAPHGNSDFIELPSQANPERDINLYWGQNFSAKLDKINVKSSDGWYDLRATVEDQAGNTYKLTASPAFYLKHLNSVEVNSVGKNYIVVENGIIRAAGMPDAIISIYDLQGRLLSQATGQVDASNISGVCIIKAADANNSLTSKLMIQH